MLEKILVKEIIGPIIIVAVAILIYGIFSRISKKIINKKMSFGDARKTKTMISLFNNIMKYLIAVIAILMILDIYKIDTKTIIASIGVIGAVVGLALQDSLKDFFAGLFIIFENQYALGDYIKIGDFMGEVIAIGMKTTKIRAYTGEVKIISNRFITEVINYSIKDALAIIDITVEYNADVDLAERVLKDVCKEGNKEIKYLTGKLELLGIEDLGDNGMRFRIVGPCKPMSHYDVQRIVRRKAKIALEFNNIKISYNQVVVRSE